MEYSKVKNEFWVRRGNLCLQAIQAGGSLLVWSQSLVYDESRLKPKKRMNFVVCKILDSTATEAWRHWNPSVNYRKQMKHMNRAEDLVAGPPASHKSCLKFFILGNFQGQGWNSMVFTPSTANRRGTRAAVLNLWATTLWKLNDSFTGGD